MYVPHVVDQHACAALKQDAIFGQRGAVDRTHDERHAQRAFQLANRDRDGRLRQTQRARGAMQAALLGDTQEYP